MMRATSTNLAKALYFVFSGLVLLLLSCGSEPYGGGTSEETNSIAGILINADGKPASGIGIQVRSANQVVLTKVNQFQENGPVWTDTTDSDGRWSVSLRQSGNYVALAQDSNGMVAKINFSYLGFPMILPDTLEQGHTLQGAVALRWDNAGGLHVMVPGTPWSTRTDSLGHFSMAGLTSGKHSVLVLSPDPMRYESSSFDVEIGSNTRFVGPLPAGESYDSNGVAEAWHQSTATWELPLSPEYGIGALWSMDYLKEINLVQEFYDARGRLGTAIVYGGARLVPGVVGSAIEMQGASQFAIIEDDQELLDSANALRLEAWVRIGDLPSVDSFRYNLVGKLGFGGAISKDVFSLAYMRNQCGLEGDRLAFFLSDGAQGELSCETVLVSAKAKDMDVWKHVVISWNGQTLTMFQDGLAVDSAKTEFEQIQVSDEPLFFGKGDIRIALDEVRLGRESLNAADAFYRYLSTANLMEAP